MSPRDCEILNYWLWYHTRGSIQVLFEPQVDVSIGGWQVNCSRKPQKLFAKNFLNNRSALFFQLKSHFLLWSHTRFDDLRAYSACNYKPKSEWGQWTLCSSRKIGLKSISRRAIVDLFHCEACFRGAARNSLLPNAAFREREIFHENKVSSSKYSCDMGTRQIYSWRLLTIFMSKHIGRLVIVRLFVFTSRASHRDKYGQNEETVDWTNRKWQRLAFLEASTADASTAIRTPLIVRRGARLIFWLPLLGAFIDASARANDKNPLDVEQ